MTLHTNAFDPRNRLTLSGFERLVDEGRHALESGRAEHAAAVLHEGLALWRGPPLAELARFTNASVAIEHDLLLS